MEETLTPTPEEIPAAPEAAEEEEKKEE